MPGTRFDFGRKLVRRNSPADWGAVLEAAKKGTFENIPPDIMVRCYSQLTRIAKDNMVPYACERVCEVYWGRTGAGKSKLAWETAGLGAYPKDPSTKWY